MEPRRESESRYMEEIKSEHMQVREALIAAESDGSKEFGECSDKDVIEEAEGNCADNRNGQNLKICSDQRYFKEIDEASRVARRSNFGLSTIDLLPFELVLVAEPFNPQAPLVIPNSFCIGPDSAKSFPTNQTKLNNFFRQSSFPNN
ncbi:hypothetical protein AYI69_g4549 [Smittium culicis]|uniref:Uncharacterized protein n=1 Tax=Smittium culicis TaxID=133412 RepID=A0A1R1XW03_9FUNG|nr:hypothetical protein AYI69_g6857 [Smittium culicis]OMJ24669.1 hypothetical protein AYI69_g4549 [Smittium culicis]